MEVTGGRRFRKPEAARLPGKNSPARTGGESRASAPPGPVTPHNAPFPTYEGSLLMRDRAQATVRVWKKRLEHENHSRFGNRGGAGFRSRRGLSNDDSA